MSLRTCLTCLLLATLGCGDGSSSTPSDTTDTTDAADGIAETTAEIDAETAADLAVEDTAPGDDGDSAEVDAGDTAAPTVHRVGYRVETIAYLPADGSAERSLRVAAWYPTAAETGAEVRYLGLLPRPELLGDAPPDTALGPLPVVVFSHGNSSFAEQSFFLTEHLAAHGYLVVALDHTGNTFADSPDVAIFQWRPQDVSAVIDHLVALPAAHPLADLVGDAIALAGHSFGGYTTLAVGGAAWDVDALLAYCEVDSIPLDGCASLAAHESLYRAGFLDPRVDALIPMTPGATVVFGAAGAEAIAVPTLLMTGALDKTTTNAADGDPTWAQLTRASPENRRLDFATAGHFTFSDACALPVAIGEDDGCGPGFLPPERAHAAINAYARAFLDLHLRGDDRGASLLDGELTIETDVTLSLP